MDSRLKRITLIASSYAPETCAPAKRLQALAKTLSERGHRVTMIAPLPNYPQGRIYDGFSHRPIQRTEEDGVRVYRLLPWIVPKSNLILRLLAEIYFALFASGIYLLNARADLVIASSPSMFVGPFGRIVSKLTGAKFVWDVRDLIWRYTQAIGETGVKRLAGDWLERLMIWTAKGANLLTATTEGQRAYFIQRGVLAERTRLLPNGVSESFFDALQHEDRTARGDQDFRLIYAGLIGYPQGLGTLVSAAKLLQPVGVQVIIAGEGVERAELVQRCQDEGIANVSFPGYLSQADLGCLYRSGDVLYAQLRGEPVFASAQPSKIWEYLAAGRPVIYGGIGEAAEAVRRSQGGLTVTPDDPEALAVAVRQLKADPVRAEAMGAIGRRYVAENLIRERLMNQASEAFEGLLGLSRQG
ncbi:MAG: glycosyltransferase family 4 protein [Acidobacteria bacterium]|nr:glycosyltransferase family 4 protein [Acidobacteriota bacterium]